MWLLLGLLIAAGCDQVYDVADTTQGTDFDEDGVVDAIDPCIAGWTDLHGDQDFDRIENAFDACPLDPTRARREDADGDGIPDLCDPDSTVAVDRLRCPMLLSNPDLNSTFWRQAPDRHDWRFDRSGLLLMGDSTPRRIVASASIESSTVATYDVLASVGTQVLGSPVVVRVFARAGDDPSPDDVGCEVRWQTGSGLVAVRGASAESAMALLPAVFRLRMTVAPDGGIRCSVGDAHAPLPAFVEAEAQVALPPGDFAFEASETTMIQALVIYDRFPTRGGP